MSALGVMGKEFRYEVCCREIFQDRGTLKGKKLANKDVIFTLFSSRGLDDVKASETRVQAEVHLKEVPLISVFGRYGPIMTTDLELQSL